MKTLKLFVLLALVIATTYQSFAQDRINFQGLNRDGEGAVAYPANGHVIPAHLVNNQNIRAYFNIASADIDPNDRIRNAKGAAHFTNVANGFPNLSAALAANPNISLSELRISFGSLNLGEDLQNQDWEVVGNVEKRYYRGGMLKLKYGNTIIATNRIPRLTIEIDYRNTSVNGDELFSGYTNERLLTFENNLQGDAATIANAIESDLNGCRVKFVYSSLESAVRPNSQYALFNAQQGYMEKVNCGNNNNNNANNNNNTSSGNTGTINFTKITKPNLKLSPLGEWIPKVKGKGLVKLKISKSGYNVSVQTWASCSPKPCDWGTAKITQMKDGRYKGV